MYNTLTYRSIYRFSTGHGFEEIQDVMIQEHAYDVIVNDLNYTRLVCTPAHLEELVVGHLALAGVIRKYQDIINLEISDTLIRAETAEVQADPVNADEKINAEENKFYAEDITAVMKKHLNSSKLHQLTGGVHIMSLAQGADLLVSREDIGRHNAVDKIYGYCLINNISYEGKMFLSSGRTTYEIIQKLYKMGVKVVVGRAAVTDLARDIADRAGITVIGFARGDKFNIYTHPERIVTRG
ncbi:MAG: formate dehydrogenase accessory sulfurtransferase FdhD [Syntrophomonadaceae bacterium]